jgi:hypothetical protein
MFCLPIFWRYHNGEDVESKHVVVKSTSAYWMTLRLSIRRLLAVYFSSSVKSTYAPPLFLNPSFIRFEITATKGQQSINRYLH